MEFWQSINRALDRIAVEKPDTFDAVKAILDEGGDPDNVASKGPDSTFFAGSGGDPSLFGALNYAGWRMVWSEAGYYYVARHNDTRELLTYIEGDVERGNTAPGVILT